MKYLLIIFSFLITSANADAIKVTWDAPQTTVDGYEVYSSGVCEKFNYGAPVCSTDAIGCEFEADSPQKLVSRSFIMDGDTKKYSINSNQIYYPADYKFKGCGNKSIGNGLGHTSSCPSCGIGSAKFGQ